MNITKLINTANDKFSKRLPSIETKLFDRVMLMSKDLKLRGGKVVNSVDNLKLIIKIKKELLKIAVNKSYLNDVKELTETINNISTQQTEYFKTLSDEAINNEKYSLVRKEATQNLISGLTKAGIESNVTSKINQILLNSVTSGVNYTDMTNQLKSFIVSDKETEGALSKYAKTYSITSLNQFAGQNNKMITDDLGLEWFMYQGTEIKTTREFCHEMLQKQYVHKSEIPALLRGEVDGHQCRISDSTGLPLGMIEGTTAENFPVYCGGWNCGHKLTPISDIIVPKILKAKFKNK